MESEDIGYHPSYSLFGPTRIQLVNVIHLKVIDILKRCAYNIKCNYNPWYQCLKIVPKLRYPAHEMRNQLADKIDKRLDWREPCDRKAFREGFLYVRSPVSGEMDPVCDVAKDIYSRCCLQIRFPKQILRKQKYITQTQKILFACGLPLIQISNYYKTAVGKSIGNSVGCTISQLFGRFKSRLEPPQKRGCNRFFPLTQRPKTTRNLMGKDHDERSFFLGEGPGR